MKSLFLILVAISYIFANPISEYRVIKKEYEDNNQKYIAIREYIKDNNKHYLVVNSDTLKTKIITNIEPKEYKKNDTLLIEKVYKRAKISKENIHNTGINRAYKIKKDVQYLTIDMCPSSKKSYEKELYNTLNKKPNKIAIALSAKWAIKHKKEFNEILSMKNLDITWINHTYNHHYYPKLPLEKNFLLAKGTDLYKEIIANEKYMLSHGIVPSIFIRFPGLVSNADMIDKIVDRYSLIPLGSDTWIAKNQKIKDSSIILVHGNLNEKKGIKMFLKEYKKGELRLEELNYMFK
jgi:peptidoglycan/xylan/chitin deacetylase (PgdA/CDA1 family)